MLIIPIVFHIIHFNGPENISNAQIHDAVDVLNTNLRALNDNIGDVIPEFEDLVADIEIEFSLAQRDPQGNCHPGINRVVSELTYVGDSEMKSTHPVASQQIPQRMGLRGRCGRSRLRLVSSMGSRCTRKRMAL